jgi:hypothetical protein
MRFGVFGGTSVDGLAVKKETTPGCQLALQIVPLVCTSNSTTLGLRGGKVGTGTV